MESMAVSRHASIIGLLNEFPGGWLDGFREKIN